MAKLTRGFAMYKELGQRIREQRLQAGINQTQLGKVIGVSYQQLQKYETGQNRIPIHRLLKAAEVLNVSSGQLIGVEVIHIPQRMMQLQKEVGELEKDLAKWGGICTEYLDEIETLKDLCKQKDESIDYYASEMRNYRSLYYQEVEDFDNEVNKTWWRRLCGI